jgi:hypothetical protein
MAAERYMDDDQKREAFFYWLSAALDTGSLICVAIPVSLLQPVTVTRCHCVCHCLSVPLSLCHP